MSAANEQIVREYFESLGFLVSQPQKYTVPGRQKRPAEKIDLIIFNPLVPQQEIPDHLVWRTPDLRRIARAIVGIRGWHTERFSSSRLEQNPDILEIAEEKTVSLGAARFGTREIAKILCVPQLPASGDQRDKTLRKLKEKGIDGVISYQDILQELISGIDTNKNYEKSDVLQVIRILKNYDLLKDTQMELFGGRRRKKRSAAEAPSTPADDSRA